MADSAAPLISPSMQPKMKRAAPRPRREAAHDGRLGFDPKLAMKILLAHAEEAHAAGQPAFRIAEQVCQEGLRYDLHLTYSQAMGVVIEAVENVARGERTQVAEVSGKLPVV